MVVQLQECMKCHTELHTLRLKMVTLCYIWFSIIKKTSKNKNQPSTPYASTHVLSASVGSGPGDTEAFGIRGWRWTSHREKLPVLTQQSV